jgi:type I restriction enzyme S subunit
VIALLNEQKQVIIHRAVTRGLDPAVRLKPSSIPWLMEIPMHWEEVPLGKLLSYGPKNGISPAAAPRDSIGVTSFSISAIRDGEVRIEGNQKQVSLASSLISSFSISNGDILFVRGNGNIDFVARCGLVSECHDTVVYPDIIIKVRPNDKIVADFLVHAVNSEYMRHQVRCVAKTTNGAFKISGGRLTSLKLAVPPLDEQRSILDAVSKSWDALSQIKNAALAEIELLTEYRNRLISDVVTGKLDVREAASKIPDEEAPVVEDAETDLDLDPELAEVAEIEASL